ncbi:phage tail tip protein J-related protein, partial [Escherichia coli]
PDDGAPFRYSFSALKDRHNTVEVNWIDPNNGWETATELVEDTQAIARYGRNVTKMDAFGCTSRGQAHRAGLWLIKTELLETQTVDFSVGAEGLTDIRQVETTARYLGTGLYWIAASINIKPGHDYYFYIRSVNTVGKSAFVEAVGRASDDAEGYLDFFKGKITESHLGKELLEKVDLTEDNASKLEQFSKEWKDANDKWNAMWGVKIEQTKDGKHYVAGIGLS